MRLCDGVKACEDVKLVVTDGDFVCEIVMDLVCVVDAICVRVDVSDGAACDDATQKTSTVNHKMLVQGRIIMTQTQKRTRSTPSDLSIFEHLIMKSLFAW